MKPTHEQHEDFLAHRPVHGVTFEHNDAVDIVFGDHSGEAGSIISVEELGEDPLYLIELSSGHDVTIRQSHLQLADG